MLVLSRGPQDKVFFPRLGICVEVLRIANRQVRLGITAPKDVKIARDESYASQIESDGQDVSLSESDRDRVAAANKLVLQAATLLAANDPHEAMKLLNLALSEFDALDNCREIGGRVQESRATYSRSQVTPPRRLLLVDENEQSRTSLAQLLRLKGFEVTDADDAFRALYQLSSCNPVDAVLIDFTVQLEHLRLTLRQILSKPTATRPQFSVSENWTMQSPLRTVLT